MERRAWLNPCRLLVLKRNTMFAEVAGEYRVDFRDLSRYHGDSGVFCGNCAQALTRWLENFARTIDAPVLPC
jgi:hypothetical protein